MNARRVIPNSIIVQATISRRVISIDCPSGFLGVSMEHSGLSKGMPEDNKSVCKAWRSPMKLKFVQSFLKEISSQKEGQISLASFMSHFQ